VGHAPNDNKRGPRVRRGFHPSIRGGGDPAPPYHAKLARAGDPLKPRPFKDEERQSRNAHHKNYLLQYCGRQDTGFRRAQDGDGCGSRNGEMKLMP
jgi:hypothetical protein